MRRVYTALVLRMHYSLKMRNNRAKGEYVTIAASNERSMLNIIYIKRQKKFCFTIIFILIVLILLLITLLTYRRNPKLPVMLLNSSIESYNTNHSRRIILDWTGFFHKPFSIDHSTNNCANQNCLITNNRRLFNRSSIVIFHWYDMKLDDLPDYRFPDQYFVIFTLESPAGRSDLNSLDLKLLPDGFFNLTMTYRRDSDVFYPYGTFVRENLTPIYRTMEDFEPHFKEKSGLVAWFVSNCNIETSGRNAYAQALSKHISVDIYGECGQYKCQNRSSCYRMLNQKYKFYLSFENSNCQDYVTEKFMNVMTPELYVIPIVLYKKNYENFAPNGSYISVEDFPSAQALAQYLLMLANDIESYWSYLTYKSSYKVAGCQKDEQCGQCRLCEIANTIPPPRNIVQDFTNWWFKPDVCIYNLVDRLLK